jgi:DNA-binding transcriptional ArsR family regulator
MTDEVLTLVAMRFKALSEPLRLRILHTLKAGEHSVTEITEAVGSTQPNISKHLKMLRDAGLLRRRQAGNTVYYSIMDHTIFALCEVVCSSLYERLAAQASALADRTAVEANGSGAAATSGTVGPYHDPCA